MYPANYLVDPAIKIYPVFSSFALVIINPANTNSSLRVGSKALN